MVENQRNLRRFPYFDNAIFESFKIKLVSKDEFEVFLKLKFTELGAKMNVYELYLKEIMKQYIIRVHGKRILEPKRKFFLKYSAPFRRSTFVLIQCSTKDLYFTTNCILNGLYMFTDKYPRWWENGQKRSKNELLVRKREIDLEKRI